MIDPAKVDLDIIRFHRRVRSGILAKIIEDSLDEVSLKTLILKKYDFAWKNTASRYIDHDGPTMLQILIEEINPTTCARVPDFKKSIQNCKLSIFGNNGEDMIDNMDYNYQEIVTHNHTHYNYTMYLFNALLTSKNEVFRSMVQCKKDDWELGGDVNDN